MNIDDFLFLEDATKRPVTPLDDVFQSFLAQHPRGVSIGEVFRHWKVIVSDTLGPAYVQDTMPQRILNGRLMVACRDTVMLAELNLAKEQIMEAFRSYIKGEEGQDLLFDDLHFYFFYQYDELSLAEEARPSSSFRPSAQSKSKMSSLEGSVSGQPFVRGTGSLEFENPSAYQTRTSLQGNVRTKHKMHPMRQTHSTRYVRLEDLVSIYPEAGIASSFFDHEDLR